MQDYYNRSQCYCKRGERLSSTLIQQRKLGIYSQGAEQPQEWMEKSPSGDIKDRGLLWNWPDAILANDSPRTKCCQEWRWGTRVIRYQGLGLTRILAKSRLTKEGHGSQGRGLLGKRAQRSLTRILSRSFLVTAVHRICGRIPESRLMRKLAGKY